MFSIRNLISIFGYYCGFSDFVELCFVIYENRNIIIEMNEFRMEKDIEWIFCYVIFGFYFYLYNCFYFNLRRVNLFLKLIKVGVIKI